MTDTLDAPDPADNELLDNEGPAVEVRGLTSAFGENVIHQDLEITALRGEVLGVVGGSGSGKSVLLNTIIGRREARSMSWPNTRITPPCGSRRPMMVLSNTDLPEPDPPTTPRTSPRRAVISRS